MELDDITYDKITALTDKGNSLMETGDFKQALSVFETAFTLIPQPKEEWEVTSWVYAAIGDAYFFMENYTLALNAFMSAMTCLDDFSNPFIPLRIGQCFYETGQLDKGKEYLLRAYMLEGDELFEEEDVKYLNFLKK